MNLKDREILRELAKKQINIANSEHNLNLVKEWKRHNARKPGRPMVHIDLWSFEAEVIPPLLRCQDPVARQIEATIYNTFICQELFDDDQPVPPYYPLIVWAPFNLFGHEVVETHADDGNGKQVGTTFNYIVEDLEDDYEKLGESTFTFDWAGMDYMENLVNEVLGDILPVRRTGMSSICGPTRDILYLMGMQNMYLNMIQYPELFSTMINRAADDYLRYFKWMEENNLLLPLTGFETLNQASYCFTDELPSEGHITTKDCWLFMDSQETLDISPAMFEELVLPVYKRIAEQFGLLSYGCCEPVSKFWDQLKTLPNLRKLSISAWCDQEFIGERLRGTDIIYHRKPSALFLGGTHEELDEDEVREDMKRTMLAARGCTLEITQREVYTIHRNPQKVRRFVELIREAYEKYWNA